MINISELFKGKIPTRRKLYYNLIYSNPDLKDLTLRRFKKDNFELKIFESSFLSMDRYNYLPISVIKNIFKYLSVNLKYSTYNNVKNIVIYVNSIKKEIKNKLKNLDEIEDKDLICSLKYINYNIDLLKIILSNQLDIDSDELEKIMDFESVTRSILRPEYYDEMMAVKIIFENLKLLNYHDHRNRTFSDLICNSIEYAKIYKNDVQLEYYKKIINYIVNIKNLNISKKRIYEELEYSYDYDIDVKDKSVLEEKIKSFDYDSLEGRYIIDDYILSIDNKETIKIDDALSVEKTSNNTYILGIHITDVCSIGSFKLDGKEFSKEFLNKLKGSLKEQAKRKAITLLVEISNNGEVINYRLLPTILSVDKNLHYSEIPKLLYNSEKEKYDLQRTLDDLVSLYQVVENTQMPVYPSIDNIAHLLITKFMLLNGCIYSEYFDNNDIPCIYLAGDKKNNKYTLNKDTYNAGFYRYNTYSKTTSPLYDKSSLISQYLLHECAFKNKTDNYKRILHYRLLPIVEKLNKK